jgi:tryptophanase
LFNRHSCHAIEERIEANTISGFQYIPSQKPQPFLDMLTDSGTNAMSDNQQSAMLLSDDAYAGSESFYKLERSCSRYFWFEICKFQHIKVEPGEHLIAKVFVKPGTYVITNYHFTTTKAHIPAMRRGKS